MTARGADWQDADLVYQTTTRLVVFWTSTLSCKVWIDIIATAPTLNSSRSQLASLSLKRHNGKGSRMEENLIKASTKA